MISDVSLGVLSLPGRVRSHPEKNSVTFVTLACTVINNTTFNDMPFSTKKFAMLYK